VTAAYAAAAGGGDTCAPSANTFLHVKNAGGSPVTVTVAATAVPAPNMVITNLAVSVPATTGDKMIGPIRADLFRDPTTGQAAITYSGVTSVTIGVFEMVAG
jgi:hypothetical protein